jgi:Zn-dependent M28 family amino/carboxypeptidase
VAAVDKLLGKLKLSKLQAEIDAGPKPRSGPLPGVTVALSVAIEPVTTQVPNVLASLPGSDLAQEIVLIGAHYDHIGQAGLGQCGEARSGGSSTSICNGADDNASGTAMVLELARAYKQSGRAPRRTIVFVNFAGEELGVLGSKALAEAPPFDLKRVVAMVNLDMVGRLGPKGLAIGGLGSSEAGCRCSTRSGPRGLEILYEGSVATRSDHASFYRKDIPVLFFFTGVHSDYHRPGDHADKINLVGMTAIGQIVGGVMQALGDGLPVPWKPAGPDGGLSQGLPGSDPKRPWSSA